jgi:hypothetical protein
MLRILSSISRDPPGGTRHFDMRPVWNSDNDSLFCSQVVNVPVHIM